MRALLCGIRTELLITGGALFSAFSSVSRQDIKSGGCLIGEGYSPLKSNKVHMNALNLTGISSV